jgi:hypothetical protein
MMPLITSLITYGVVFGVFVALGYKIIKYWEGR